MPNDKPDLTSYMNNKVASGEITQQDKDLIDSFITERTATCNLKHSTSVATGKALCKFVGLLDDEKRKVLSPIEECNTADVFKALKIVSTRWKQNTRRLRIFYLKEFLLWLIDEGVNTELSVKKIRAIRPPPSDRNTKTPSQMQSADVVDKMIKAGKNIRDRAMLAMIYEGALRPIEAKDATWGQVKFDAAGLIFTTSKKTGKVRYIRITAYAHYLALWKSEYRPGTPDDDKLIFVTRDGNPLSRAYFDQIIKDAGKAVGIEDVFPYMLRHWRITQMDADGYQESVIKLQCWGHLNTPMLGTYSHLSNKQVDEIILEKQGIKRFKRLKGPSVKPVQCPSCNTINIPGARFCYACSTGLTEEAIESLKDAKKALANNENIKVERFAEMYKDAKNKGLID